MGSSCLGMGTLVACLGWWSCLFPKPNAAKQAMAPAQLGEKQRASCREFIIFSIHGAARPAAADTVLHSSRPWFWGPDPLVPHSSFLFFLLPSLPHLACPSHLWMSSPCQHCGPVVTQSQPYMTETWLTRSPRSPAGPCELQLDPSPCIQNQPQPPLYPHPPFNKWV